MKQFSQIIRIIELTSSKELNVLVDPFILEPTPETSNQGTAYSVDLNLSSTDEIPAAWVGREFNARIYINNGAILFGDEDYPTKCLISPYLNHYAIKITSKQPYPII